MMNKFRLLLLASSLFVLNGIGHAQTSTMSLNSSNPKIVWEVKPQADLNNIGGEQISTPGFKMPDYVKGVVPGAVFTAYVEAGIVPDPNYADNIYKVDETFITVLSSIVRSLNFRHLIQQVSVFGFILIIPTVSQISILMEKKYRERRHPLKM